MLPEVMPVDGEGVACEALGGGMDVAVGPVVRLVAYCFPAPVPFGVFVELVAVL